MTTPDDPAPRRSGASDRASRHSGGPGGSTRVAGVIGSPVRHSLSPRLHNAAFAALDLDWVFLAFEVSEGDVPRAFDGIRALGIDGLSVTMPHKAAAAAAVDRLSDDAAELGAVNCVARDGEVLLGSNTDGAGFLRALEAEVGFSPAGASCAVVGAGGAARAVVLACARAGASEIVVVNRTPERAERAAALAGPNGRSAPATALSGVDLVVNATPIGMGADAGALPFDPELLRPGQVVADLIYEPRATALVVEARRRGLTAVNGLGMLVHQAAIAFETWTGAAAPIEAMTAAMPHDLH